MKIISLNTNGIRSASKKGVFDWLKSEQADVVCIQETKAQIDELTDPVFYPEGYHCFYRDAVKKGYSGVALYARQKPDKVIDTLGYDEFDAEGRYIEAQFGDLSVASLYLPSGSSSPERQQAKFRFMALFMPELKERVHANRHYILCGDWNIAHKQIDLKNWRSNQKNSGFLPEERAWMDVVFGECGWVDAYRHLHPDIEGEAYTWWSNRGQAWANNVGWRIDYQIVSASLRDKIRSAHVYKAQRFSDHAPLVMEYDL